MFRLIERERTPRALMLYAVYMYFQGLSVRAVSACLEDICPRSHVSVWRWVQRFSRLNDCFTVRRVRCFLVDQGRQSGGVVMVGVRAVREVLCRLLPFADA